MEGRVFLIILLPLILAACGGGGGGGGGGSVVSSGSSSSWVSSVSTSESSAYKTTEYNKQWGLASINAAEAYALLANNFKTVAGSGVKIGIVDTGVETSHVEISANYSSSGSYNYVDGNYSMSDDYGHGTHVSSIAAGVKDGSGMHGVAYDATIVAERALGNCTSSGCDFYPSAISGAASAGAKVINLSIGSISASTLVRTALTTAKSLDALSVAATGNDTATQPRYPAYYAADSDLLGYVLAVGSVDSTSTIASDSNKCGDAANYCLVAPGVSVYAAYPTSTYTTLSGTSMATPHVTGAAAVIRGAWPHLTAPQTAQILLTTATDLGTAGVDTTYGHGMLNLYAAVQAQGQNTLGYGLSVSGGGYELTSSSIVTSSIFGDAFASNVAPALSSAIFFDDYGRDYKANLADKISLKTSNNITNLNNFIFNNTTSKTAPLAFGEDLRSRLNFNISTYKNAEAQNYFGLKFLTVDRSIDPQNSLNKGFSFVRDSSDFAPNLKLGFAVNVDEITNLNSGDFANSGFISQKNLAANPYQSFLQSYSPTFQNSRQFNQIFASQNLFAKKLALTFSYQSSYDSAQMLSGMGNKQNQIFDFGLALKPKSGSSFLLSAGNLSEFDHNILNSKSVGAFESGGGVKTSYAKISASQNLTKNLQFLASYSEGISKINGNQVGIFREFDNVRSRSLSASLLWDDFFKGKIGLGYLEPMRVYQGNVKIDIPVARDLAGNLTRLQSTASLVSQGKEYDLEIFYLRELSKDSQVKFNFVRQLQANNVKTAPTNYLGFLQFLVSY